MLDGKAMFFVKIYPFKRPRWYSLYGQNQKKISDRFCTCSFILYLQSTTNTAFVGLESLLWVLRISSSILTLLLRNILQTRIVSYSLILSVMFTMM